MNFLSVKALYTEHHAYFAAQLRTGTCNRLYLYSSRFASQIPIILDIKEPRDVFHCLLIRTKPPTRKSCNDYSFQLAAFVIPLSIDYNMGDLSYLHVEKPKCIRPHGFIYSSKVLSSVPPFPSLFSAAVS